MKSITLKKQIIIVTALPCEARPLIHHFKLKRLHAVHAFPVYQCEDDLLILIVSGVGIINSAAATVFATQYVTSEISAFVNVGIAGGYYIKLGELFLVDKISNSSDDCFYPMALSYFRMPKQSLLTVQKARSAEQGCLVDMEAYGFFQAASRFSSAELIHCIKIVSDNQFQDTSQINKVSVEGWINMNLDKIAFFLEKLIHLMDRQVQDILEVDTQLKNLYQNFHFTQYQRHEARDLMRKLASIDTSFDFLSSLEKTNSAKGWLIMAREKLTQNSLNI